MLETHKNSEHGEKDIWTITAGVRPLLDSFNNWPFIDQSRIIVPLIDTVAIYFPLLDNATNLIGDLCASKITDGVEDGIVITVTEFIRISFA